MKKLIEIVLYPFQKAKQSLCKHTYGEVSIEYPTKDYSEAFQTNPVTGDQTPCLRRHFFVTQTCTRCGHVKIDEGYDQSPIPEEENRERIDFEKYRKEEAKRTSTIKSRFKNRNLKGK